MSASAEAAATLMQTVVTTAWSNACGMWLHVVGSEGQSV